jgi:2-hydroxychromene-2-carboxylate isomerase
MTTLDFWFDFASTYSYLSAVRIDEMARARGVAVRWRPFLLGPVFASQGWASSPFNIYPAKGRYMVRDISRIAQARGIAFVMPDPFPQPSLLAARAALAIEDEAQRAMFSRAVFEHQFARGFSIDDPFAIGGCAAKAGLNAAAVLQASRTDAVKARLRAETEDAQRLGIFGAPMFVTEDGELFWGDDRLEQAMGWGQQVR